MRIRSIPGSRMVLLLRGMSGRSLLPTESASSVSSGTS
jgi:hypothetical protein